MMPRWRFGLLTAAAHVCGCAVLLHAGHAHREHEQSARNQQSVEAIYAARCATCHDRSGLDAVFVQAVEGPDADARMASTIMNGHARGKALPQRGALSAGEIRSLIVYIRERADRVRRGSGTAGVSPGAAVTIQTVTEAVVNPWALEFLPDGRLLVTERQGALRVLALDRPVPDTVSDTPAVWSRGQGGLLDVAVHPRYRENGWIYLAYTEANPAGAAMVVVVRGRLSGANGWTDQQVVFRAPPTAYRISMAHFGARLLFDREGHLLFCIGDTAHSAEAQIRSFPGGKVHRLADDGGLLSDNPFASSPGEESVWTYGHRNPQGLALDPVTNVVWEVEHGPRGGDELNLLVSGANYGWPQVTYGINYDGTAGGDATGRSDIAAPTHYWIPSIGPSAIAVYHGDKFPAWHNTLLVGGLLTEDVRRLVVVNGHVVSEEVVVNGVGRVRDVIVGLDGYVYLALNGPDRIVRLVPRTSGSAPE